METKKEKAFFMLYFLFLLHWHYYVKIIFSWLRTHSNSFHFFCEFKCDFFRIYSQHLILYAPIKSENTNREKSLLPQFRKNIYTREIIDFILERIRTNEMSKNEVIERYRIPKTTLYKWISKYSLIKAK